MVSFYSVGGLSLCKFLYSVGVISIQEFRNFLHILEQRCKHVLTDMMFPTFFVSWTDDVSFDLDKSKDISDHRV